MDVPHYTLKQEVIDYFMLHQMNNVPVFYLSDNSNVEQLSGIGADLLGEKEIGDIQYPKLHNENIPLNDIFKNLKIE
uniref:Uncharacterized protein n=1 Tax=Panagrolaimus superbus TaxID=310955 RepID=A0A914YN09_9BILA